MINRLPKKFPTLSRASAAPAARRMSGLSNEEPGGSSRIIGAAADCVGSRPVLSLGFAFALGVVLGKLVKR